LIQVSRFNDVCIRRSLSLSREPEEAEKAWQNQECRENKVQQSRREDKGHM
jgi:hypothetical protein